MSERKPAARWGLRLAALAALALLGGLMVGASAIYVMGSRSGNEATAANCPANEALRLALDERARGEVAAVQALAAPFDARGLAFKDDSGAALTLADFTGKTLLVNLWATWCVPCRLEMPALDALQAAEGGKDFAVVPINVDLGEPDKPKAFYAETKLAALPFYRDETMEVFNEMKRQGVAIGLPVTLLVDEAGCARAAINGPAEWASPDAIRLIGAMRGSA